MTHWIGSNWQILDEPETPAVLGVTLAIGLLDEAVEATGTLQLAVAALRNELARPVETGPGATGVPEVTAEVGLDTTTIVVRASSDTASAAWRRLPGLFRADVVTDEVVPALWESPSWPADLLVRTGPSAAATTWLGMTAADVHDRARTLLPRLAPGTGGVRSVFFTNDETLAGLCFPVETAETNTVPPQRAAGNTRGRLAGHASELASALVPRSTSGLAAAQMLRSRLDAVANTAGVDATIRGQLHGMGASARLVLLTESPLDAAARERLLIEFAKAPDLVPDIWIDTAVGSGDEPSTTFERERRVLGLGADPGVSHASIRQALATATASLHLNPGSQPPPHKKTGKTSKDAVGVRPDPSEPLAHYPWLTGQPVAERGPSFRTWRAKGDSALPSTRTTRLRFGPSTLTATSLGVETATTTIDTGRVIAIGEDQAGNLAVLDDELRNIAFHPGLFRRRAGLLKTLGERFAGVPRLPFDSGIEPALMKRFLTRTRRTTLALYALIIAFAIFLTTMITIQNTTPANVELRLEIGDTATLRNGTTIKATGFDIVWPNPDDPEATVTAHVTFCAGKDTKVSKLPPETQRTVKASDFGLFDSDYTVARPITTADQLDSITLPNEQCASGDLTFKGLNLEGPRLSYENAVGDDVIWYPYGQKPQR